ncbi:hypothetical protein RvY_03534-2 [Ramazzottius varieornatus]|uniref:Uncharacterized protein n=1 Tax=Ramazzottius varieornatus TaxID=947166 RepID=A0A1D1US59_RAMVA|nr:hypothetical protein RvY_03534-2 [Ramazzottius varieornatus]
MQIERQLDDCQYGLDTGFVSGLSISKVFVDGNESSRRRGRVARRNMPMADIPISPSPSTAVCKAQPLHHRPVYLLLLPPLHYQPALVMASTEATVKEDLALAQKVREDSWQKVRGVLAAEGAVEVAVPRRLGDYAGERHRIILSPNSSPSTHSTFLKALNVGLERTIKTVQHAMDSVFGQQFACWNAFMCQARLNGIVPYQSQISPQKMMVVISNYLTLHVQRHCDFTYQLPGFTDLQPAQQQRLLAVKWSNSWLFVHAPYFHSDDSYILAGPDRIHYGRYWY